APAIRIAPRNCGCARKLRKTLLGSKKIPVKVAMADIFGGGFGTAGIRMKLKAKSKIPSAPATAMTIPTKIIPSTNKPIPAYIKFAGRRRSGSVGSGGGGGG